MFIFCMFGVRLKNHHNIFLAHAVGHIFVKHHPIEHIFAEDDTNVFKKDICRVSGLRI